jgi:hypothetical protein
MLAPGISNVFFNYIIMNIVTSAGLNRMLNEGLKKTAIHEELLYYELLYYTVVFVAKVRILDEKKTKTQLQVLICCDSKLPETVDTADLSKPLYRRDIFYSGNLIHVDEFKSQPDVGKAEYTRSVTAIPVDDEPLQSYAICGCIPVSKTVYNTVKQVNCSKTARLLFKMVVGAHCSIVCL